MKIATITAVYNEEDLLPLFLKHYDYVDEIHIILDMATDDRTLAILTTDKRVIVHPIEYPGGLDWIKKQDAVNRLALNLDADWLYAIDADEFIWPPWFMERPRAFLSEATGNLLYASMWQVYRHRDEGDIDPLRYPAGQRRHGSKQVGVSYGYPLYRKPVVVRSGQGIQWDCGCHAYLPNPQIVLNQHHYRGAHWCMADPDLAVKRRLAQKARQGEENLKHGRGIQNHHVTEDEIRAECAAHLNDPRLF